jgi:hypothetical protein
MKEHPKAGKRRWFELYRAEIEADEDLKEALLDEVFRRRRD